jgi:hypothetical protein
MRRDRAGGCALWGCGRASRLAHDMSREASRVGEAFGRVASGPRCRVPGKTEVTVPGQLALVIETETVVPVAVWETLPPEHRLQLALRLARLLARLVEAARDE